MEAVQVREIDHDGLVALTLDEVAQHSGEQRRDRAVDLAVEGHDNRAEGSADDERRWGNR